MTPEQLDIHIANGPHGWGDRYVAGCPSCQRKARSKQKDYRDRRRNAKRAAEYGSPPYTKYEYRGFRRLPPDPTQRRAWLGEYKVDKGCEQCGYSEHPAALTLEHRDLATRLFSPNEVTRKFETWIEEILKCRVLCFNCHRISLAEQGRIGRPRSA